MSTNPSLRQEPTDQPAPLFAPPAPSFIEILAANGRFIDEADVPSFPFDDLLDPEPPISESEYGFPVDPDEPTEVLFQFRT